VAVKPPSTARSRTEFALGFALGVGGILFLVTVLLELTGQDALLWALLLAAAVAAIAILLVRRRRLMRQQ